MKKMIFSLLSFASILCGATNAQCRFESYMKTNNGKEIVQTSFYGHARRAQSNTFNIEELISQITNNDCCINTADYEIYGNLDEFTANDFRNKVNEGSDKIYLHYETNGNTILPYVALMAVKKNNKVIYYEFSGDEFLDSNDVKNEIMLFIRRNYDKYALNFDFDEIQTYASDDVPKTFVDCTIDKFYDYKFGKHGYLNAHIGVDRYAANSISTLYVVNVDNEFVPGRVARENGDTSFSDCYLKSGYVHLEVLQAYDKTQENGTRYGATPSMKDYWPVNNPAVVTIGSSFSNSTTLGYSYSNGFSLDNINVETDKNYSKTISYSYSKQITFTDPVLSAQRSGNQAQWSFNTVDESITEKQTYHQKTSYMFEMKNNAGDMRIGDFRLKLDYKAGFHCKNMFGYHILKNYGSVSYDLMVQSQVSPSIYDFNDGLY